MCRHQLIDFFSIVANYTFVDEMSRSIEIKPISSGISLSRELNVVSKPKTHIDGKTILPQKLSL